MGCNQTKSTDEKNPAKQTDETQDRQWESFPKPRGWSMDWDERGLVPGRPGNQKD